MVQAQNATNTTSTPMNMTGYTMMPTVTGTMNVTDKNGCGRLDSSTLLLPLALAASLLHGWSQ